MNPNDPMDGTPPSEPALTSAAPASDAWDCRLRGLSLLQASILQLVASDYTDAQIRKRLTLTPAELRQELLAAQVRLGARTRLGAVAKAFRGGWIS